MEVHSTMEKKKLSYSNGNFNGNGLLLLKCGGRNGCLGPEKNF